MNEFTDLDLRLRVKQRVSQRLVAEEAGGFAQDLQVHAVVVFGNEQAEEQLDGTAVGRIKGEWRGGPQKDGGGFGDALDAAVGKRAAAAEAGGTEFFACEERVEGLRVGKTSGGFEDEARLFVEPCGTVESKTSFSVPKGWRSQSLRRERAEGMPAQVRYLATVRRAMGTPCF